MSTETMNNRDLLELAAKACEERAGPIETYNRSYPHYLECAAAIRALAAKDDPT